jgi:hypothetical protein
MDELCKILYLLVYVLFVFIFVTCYTILMIGGSSSGKGWELKRPGREADQSPPSSAEVKSAWSYTSTPPIRLQGVVLSWSYSLRSSNNEN